MIDFLSPCICRLLKILPTLFFAFVDRSVRLVFSLETKIPGMELMELSNPFEYIRTLIWNL